jgi:hypothetical protein
MELDGLAIRALGVLSRKSPSDGHYQSEKEMDDHLLACQQILEREPHSDTPYYKVSIILEN